MIEVERKFRITDQQKRDIEDALKDLDSDAAFTRQSDLVFLQGIDSFAEFTKGMPVIRIRTEGAVTTLTYKRGVNEAGDSIEHELIIDDAGAMQAILAEMDYRLVTKVEKDRLQVHSGPITFALDVVDDIGSFLEIEILAEDTADLDELEKRIMGEAEKYDLDEADIETRKYDQMIADLQ